MVGSKVRGEEGEESSGESYSDDDSTDSGSSSSESSRSPAIYAYVHVGIQCMYAVVIFAVVFVCTLSLCV